VKSNVFVVFVLLVGLVSCKTKPQPYQIIPKKEFVDMLIEFQLADGLYGLKPGDNRFVTDTSGYYHDICKRYGYSKRSFDSTYSYYSIRTPELGQIYDDVIAELSKMQDGYYRLQDFDSNPTKNFFKGNHRWRLPRQGRNNKIPFDIKIPKQDSGLYTIITCILFRPHDGCKNPHLTAYLWYNDGTKEGKRQYFPETLYEKSKRERLYTAQVHAKSNKFTHIRGYIVDSDGEDDFRHLEVKHFAVFR
jgi:hypothetical protein